MIEQVRQRYHVAFSDFIARQLADCEQCGAEVKLELGESSHVYRRLYCADFVRNDRQRQVIEFVPESVTIEPFTMKFRATDVHVEGISWDAAVLSHDLENIPRAALNDWFDRWFDPDDTRFDPEADLQSVIHSLIVEEGALTVDFGSAPADAFDELLDLLSAAGARRIVVGDGRADP